MPYTVKIYKISKIFRAHAQFSVIPGETIKRYNNANTVLASRTQYVSSKNYNHVPGTGVCFTHSHLGSCNNGLMRSGAL